MATREQRRQAQQHAREVAARKMVADKLRKEQLVTFAKEVVAWERRCGSPIVAVGDNWSGGDVTGFDDFSSARVSSRNQFMTPALRTAS